MAENKIQIENPANKPMHYGDFTLGEVIAPDYIPKYKLYSYIEGEKRYNDIQYDLYVDSKKIKAKRKKKFPLVLKIAAAAAALAATVLGILKLRKHH